MDAALNEYAVHLGLVAMIEVKPLGVK
jgi:hypothetical protein